MSTVELSDKALTLRTSRQIKSTTDVGRKKFAAKHTSCSWSWSIRIESQWHKILGYQSSSIDPSRFRLVYQQNSSPNCPSQELTWVPLIQRPKTGNTQTSISALVPEYSVTEWGALVQKVQEKEVEFSWLWGWNRWYVDRWKAYHTTEHQTIHPCCNHRETKTTYNTDNRRHNYDSRPYIPAPYRNQIAQNFHNTYLLQIPTNDRQNRHQHIRNPDKRRVRSFLCWNRILTSQT